MQQVEMKPSDLIVPEGFENHWVPNMTDEDYHADKSALGSSSVRLMLQSPRAFYEGHFGGKQQAESNDMRLGRIIHMALLEGPKFKERYVVMPEFWGYTKKGERTNSANATDVQEKKAAWLADRKPGEVVVTLEELDQITGMINSVLAHPQGEQVFAHGITEQAGYFRCPRTGLKMKIKPDFRGHDFFLLTDFKTARSAEKRTFGAKAFGPLRYDIQLFMYAYGAGLIQKCPMPENLFFMVCEKVWPYESAVFYLTAEQKGQAQYDFNRAIDRLVGCIKDDFWPQRQLKMEPLYTPKFFIDGDVEDHEKELDDAGQ